MWNRKPNAYRGVASTMSGKRHSERDAHRVSADFGIQAIKLTEAVGKTKQDVMDAADMGISTLNRLIRGEGSALSAIRWKRALREWGADVSALPPVDADETDGTAMPVDEPLREGFELLKRLYQLASDERFRVEIERLSKVVSAHEIVAEGTGQVGKIHKP